MKKTFIKPQAKTVAMQSQEMICQSTITQGDADGQTTFSPSGADAKRGGPFKAGDLLLDI